MKNRIIIAGLLLLYAFTCGAEVIRLDSKDGHNGTQVWEMCKDGEDVWMPAIVPGTVLNSLVYNKIYPDPYFGLNNRIEEGRIPDISVAGRAFYTYWFRTFIDIPESFAGQQIWLHPEGINYRAEIWFNDHLVSVMNGMFNDDTINVTDWAEPGKKNKLAVKVFPVDEPGTTMPKQWGAAGEFHNGGNGNIGVNTTMLMTVGWDFTFMDGIRDRNTGIWKSISLYTTGLVDLRNAFVKSELEKPLYDTAHETISVEVVNSDVGMRSYSGKVIAEIVGEGIRVEKPFEVYRGGIETVTFTPEDFPQLTISNPRLWWPVNKGPQNMYDLRVTAEVDGKVSDSLETRFGIREIRTDRNTPDSSKVFYVNGIRTFIRGNNWIPEAMLRTDDARMEAELRYTRQSGINMLRLWGGGIAESDRFYELCDEYGILVWQEFWMTADTRHPHDYGIYYNNVTSTIKRIRNHPSLAFYVASNESTQMAGMDRFVKALDDTRDYQMQSECDGIHDGSPYKQVNPMYNYLNIASDRGSRIDGFNPEYGMPSLPLPESMRMMMDEKDLWPINHDVWSYLDGNGFHMMRTDYVALVDNYGKSSSIEEFCGKSQLLSAMNSKSVWEVWNENKLDYGDRFCSGLLFWYHNSPNPQVSSRMWDWYLEPTASLYHTMHALEALHIQFDYLKNTVSVINDRIEAAEGLKATAQVYDINSHKLLEKTVALDVPADGVAGDIITIEFPKEISQVHFINLILKDKSGKTVSRNFYWRSNDEFTGKPSITGPCTSGFESLYDMKCPVLRTKVTQQTGESGKVFTVNLKNSSSRISFFNRLQLLDTDGQPVRPAFYSDNFVTLMPGESIEITIETACMSASSVKIGSVLNVFATKPE